MSQMRDLAQIFDKTIFLNEACNSKKASEDTQKILITSQRNAHLKNIFGVYS